MASGAVSPRDGRPLPLLLLLLLLLVLPQLPPLLSLILGDLGSPGFDCLCLAASRAAGVTGAVAVDDYSAVAQTLIAAAGAIYYRMIDRR